MKDTTVGEVWKCFTIYKGKNGALQCVYFTNYIIVNLLIEYTLMTQSTPIKEYIH